MKMQPNSDTVEAERTTTMTLPAMLTSAPSPAPTRIWASWTMQVSAAQSTPVPRPLSPPPRSFSCSWRMRKGKTRAIFDVVEWDGVERAGHDAEYAAEDERGDDVGKEANQAGSHPEYKVAHKVQSLQADVREEETLHV
ncbi:hypothetical protein EYF80_034268 [Liparis tanakae]|uniref:Uncharacterized protein n=1 Tax=Liparis tanakae TaxID=230148 RepID=A0A4Z2GQ00_9TELE|nr:hypothetical protein EYF80_034268 [Liparis tanakae]